MEAAARSRAAVEMGERNALEDLFTQDIRFYSPVKVAPFKGKQVVPHHRRRRHRRTPARPAALRRQPSPQLMRWCERWPERRFAVEGAKGVGRSLAPQLASACEHVVDVPSPLSARARLLATSGDRKTDAADALHVAQVALFRHDPRKVEPEDRSTILRLLTERHDDLVNERTRIINRLYAVLRDLLPCGAATRLSPEKAAALMKGIRTANATDCCRRDREVRVQR